MFNGTFGKHTPERLFHAVVFRVSITVNSITELSFRFVNREPMLELIMRDNLTRLVKSYCIAYIIYLQIKVTGNNFVLM